MKRTSILVTLTASIALLGATALVSRSAEKANPSNVRWLGPVVSGVTEPGVIGGPFPKADPSIEIGLRDDGVVVWRKRQK